MKDRWYWLRKPNNTCITPMLSGDKRILPNDVP
jgi:hypothetical protein